jgi:hypothetical protein
MVSANGTGIAKSQYEAQSIQVPQYQISQRPISTAPGIPVSRATTVQSVEHFAECPATDASTNQQNNTIYGRVTTKSAPKYITPTYQQTYTGVASNTTAVKPLDDVWTIEKQQAFEKLWRGAYTAEEKRSLQGMCKQIETLVASDTRYKDDLVKAKACVEKIKANTFRTNPTITPDDLSVCGVSRPADFPEYLTVPVDENALGQGELEADLSNLQNI